MTRPPVWLVGAALAAGAWLARGAVTRSDPVAERARTPSGMVYVEAGSFLMGSDDADADPDVKPRRAVTLRAYYMDRTEVTHADYARVVTGHRFDAADAARPITHLTRDEAAAFLARIGKRLPTTAEWERAARGTDGRRYPWGDEPPTARHLHLGEVLKTKPPKASTMCALPRTEAVGLYPAGVSPVGCLDMAGNAWEWVADDYSESPPRQIIRGGAFGYHERFLRCYAFSIEDAGVT